MPFEFFTYATLYPMAPLGGVFVALIGAALVLGGLWVRMRMRLLWISFPVATIAMVLSRHLADGLPAPSELQIGSLALAVLLEAIAFVIVMSRLRPRDEREVIIATLAIVGAHFLIMTPAFGPGIAALGVLCLANAGVAKLARSYSDNIVWLIDGILKLAFGAMLLCTSPTVHQVFTG